MGYRWASCGHCHQGCRGCTVLIRSVGWIRRCEPSLSYPSSQSRQTRSRQGMGYLCSQVYSQQLKGTSHVILNQTERIVRTLWCQVSPKFDKHSAALLVFQAMSFRVNSFEQIYRQCFFLMSNYIS